MSDWYKDGTANIEYEAEIMELYSEYKQTSRIWEERAERMKDTVANQKELLRQCAVFLTTNNPNFPLLKEIEKELGDRWTKKELEDAEAEAKDMMKMYNDD